MAIVIALVLIYDTQLKTALKSLFDFSFVECTHDLGAGTGEIPNKAMTASTYLGPGYQPWLARLYNPHGAWCSATNDADQYFQVQFPQVREIRQLRTQGSVAQKAWVRSYFIEHSQNGEEWKNYTKPGKVEVRKAYKLFVCWFIC